MCQLGGLGLEGRMSKGRCEKTAGTEAESGRVEQL